MACFKNKSSKKVSYLKNFVEKLRGVFEIRCQENSNKKNIALPDYIKTNMFKFIIFKQLA
jgi:hypothetical protein